MQGNTIMNVLIVDDVPENIFSLKTLLEDIFDVNIYSSISAKEAINILMNNEIDLILTDVQMPEINGFEFAKYIKEIEKLKDIPLIFITAIYNKDEYKSGGYELGAIDYITKPIDIFVLQEKLLKYIKIYKIKKELEKENKHITKLLNTPGIGYVLTNPNIDNNPVIFVNDYFCQLSGYSKDEIIGKDLKLLQVDDSDKEERLKVKRALIKKVPVTVILKNKKKNGEIYYNKVSISPIFNEETNKLEYFVGIQNDVTNMIKEKEFLEKILNTSQSIILVTNGKELKRINKRFFEIFPYENLDNFNSKHKCICELFIKRENKNYIQSEINGLSWNKYILSTPELLHEICMMDKEGNERISQIQSSDNSFKDNEEEQVITLTDITQIINHKNMMLEQSKFAAMGEMISMIAHQWRQPLTTLTLILDKMNILRQFDQLDSKKFDDHYLKSINLIQYMSKTVNDFRHFFQGNDNKEKIFLEKLIYQSYELIEPALKEESIFSKVIIEEDCRNLILNLNSSKISQVFLNLYKNSLDEFRKKQIISPCIQIKCLKDDKYLIVKIADNAGGIPPDIINKIFEPYFSTKSKNGTGLGLYMSKIIIEQQLSGLIEVTNRNGGACFKIMLPLNLVS